MSDAIDNPMSATMGKPVRCAARRPQGAAARRSGNRPAAEQGVNARGGMVWSLPYANMAARRAGLNDKE